MRPRDGACSVEPANACAVHVISEMATPVQTRENKQTSGSVFRARTCDPFGVDRTFLNGHALVLLKHMHPLEVVLHDFERVRLEDYVPNVAGLDLQAARPHSSSPLIPRRYPK